MFLATSLLQRSRTRSPSCKLGCSRCHFRLGCNMRKNSFPLQDQKTVCKSFDVNCPGVAVKAVGFRVKIGLMG
jgi:hypothetical protein